MKKITNIKELRDDLLSVYAGLRKGTTTASEAKEATNTAGIVISSCKVQMEYSKLKGEKPDVEFLEPE